MFIDDRHPIMHIKRTGFRNSSFILDEQTQTDTHISQQTDSTR